MIVFEHDRSNVLLVIHGSPGDLRSLSNVLLRLAESVGDHDHLKTPAWAGDELGDMLLDESDSLINHVKIYCLPGDPGADQSCA